MTVGVRAMGENSSRRFAGPTVSALLHDSGQASWRAFPHLSACLPLLTRFLGYSTPASVLSGVARDGWLFRNSLGWRFQPSICPQNPGDSAQPCVFPGPGARPSRIHFSLHPRQRAQINELNFTTGGDIIERGCICPFQHCCLA
jgi:hypothetical protein